MRKLSIASQIVVLFFSIILLSITIFTFVSTTITRIATEEEIYSRLIFYSGVINNYDSPNHPPVKTDDLQVEYIIINKDNVIESKNFDKFINQEDLKEIIKEFNFQPEFVYKNNIENHNDEKIYFTVNYTGNGNYIIMITDSTYINLRTKVVSSRLMITFAVISSISILIIGLWGNRLVSRIKKIQQHIDSMPKNQYKVEYDDEGFDEVGELSKSIELMRKEIYQSESSKKEMLQNISHDFKTPIAVIKSYAEAQIDGMADEESSQIIINNADILKHKVNMLLEYNSLEYLSKNREFEEVNMAELIRTIVQGYKFQTNLNIELDLDENVCFTGYRENYHTVVDNIIDNAKRYAKSTIKIILKKDRLRIYNDGEHISSTFIENAFKPYEKDSKGEFGLGLSIVKRTLDFFDMQIKVINEEVGVSFIITKGK